MSAFRQTHLAHCSAGARVVGCPVSSFFGLRLATREKRRNSRTESPSSPHLRAHTVAWRRANSVTLPDCHAVANRLAQKKAFLTVSAVTSRCIGICISHIFLFAALFVL